MVVPYSFFCFYTRNRSVKFLIKYALKILIFKVIFFMNKTHAYKTILAKILYLWFLEVYAKLMLEFLCVIDKFLL